MTLNNIFSVANLQGCTCNTCSWSNSKWEPNWLYNLKITTSLSRNVNLISRRATTFYLLFVIWIVSLLSTCNRACELSKICTTYSKFVPSILVLYAWKSLKIHFLHLNMSWISLLSYYMCKEISVVKYPIIFLRLSDRAWWPNFSMGFTCWRCNVHVSIVCLYLYLGHFESCYWQPWNDFELWSFLVSFA